MSMEFADQETLLLADFSPSGEATFMNYRMSDVETSKRGDEPHPISMFGRTSELQAKYFAATHGDAHLEERLSTIRRLVNLHEDHPDVFSVDFTVDDWGRMISDYNES